MIYDFLCTNCEKRYDIWLEVEKCMEPQLCCECGAQLTKQVTLQKPIVHTYGQFNHGLGIREKDKNSVKDHLKLKADSGHPLIPLENSKVEKTYVKPVRTEYPSANEVLQRIGKT